MGDAQREGRGTTRHGGGAQVGFRDQVGTRSGPSPAPSCRSNVSLVGKAHEGDHGGGVTNGPHQVTPRNRDVRLGRLGTAYLSTRLLSTVLLTPGVAA